MDKNEAVFEGAVWSRSDGKTYVYTQIGANQFMLLGFGKHNANRWNSTVFGPDTTFAEVEHEFENSMYSFKYVGPIAGGVRFFGEENN